MATERQVLFLGAWVTCVCACVLFWIAVIVTVVHFVSKWW